MTDGDQHVLIVDDEAQIRQFVRAGMELGGYRVTEAANGNDALREITLHTIDLVILDLALPDIDGSELLERIRGWSGVPVIVLSVRAGEVEKVKLLELGADDYVVKPFGARELMARIRAVLRRASADARKIIQFSGNQIDFERRIVTRKGEELKLTPAEYNLLSYFLHNPDRPLTRDMILNSVWGYEFFPNTRTVDAHVVKLRQKLEPDPNAPRHFLTVHGVGYRFVP